MASAPGARRKGMGSMFNQQFRRIDGICSALHRAVMAELEKETLEKRLETERVETGNERRMAAVKVSTATALPDGNAILPVSDGLIQGDSDGNKDGSDVLTREGSAQGYGAEVLQPRCPCSSHPSAWGGSGNDGAFPRSGLPQEEVHIDQHDGHGGGKVGKATDGRVVGGTRLTGHETHGNDPSSGDRVVSAAQVAAPAAAAAVAAVAAAAAGVRDPASFSTGGTRGVAEAGKRNTFTFLEDLLRATVPKRRSRSNARGGSLQKTKRKSLAATDTSKRNPSSKKLRKVGGAASGPFAGLSVCVVHLGSVTKSTIKTFARGVRDGGGQLSTHYTPGDTTHIVVDASLAATWEKLDLYFSGWDDFEDIDGGARCGAPEGVPIVSSEWMSECLRFSSVVALDRHRLTPPPRSEGALTTTTKGRRLHGASTTVDNSDAALDGLTYSASAAAAAAAGKMRPTARGEELSGLAARKEQNQQNDVKEPVDGGAAGVRATSKSLDSMIVKGGFGARNPNVGTKRHKFHCQMTGSGIHRVFNKEAADMLERLAELCAAHGGDGSVFRERGFKNAAGALKRLGVQITDVQQLKDIRRRDPDRVRGIGDSVIRELESFYAEGKMYRLDGMEADPKLKCLELFNKISWVGEVTAKKLYSEGMRSIEDVRARGQHLLNEQARICLSRHEDISQRMPRSEAAEIEAMVTKVAQSISPGIICQACGSYRRGKSDCGDVDVLIRPPEGEEDSPIFHELIERLTESGFVTDHLAIPRCQYKPGKSQTFMGICKLPGSGRLHRRLDIKLYPTSMFAFGVLYFTGSGHFNMSMRSFAKIKGLKLSDKGLCRVNSVDGKEVHKFPTYRCLREEDVFTALGLEWREPKDRDGVQVEAYTSWGAEGAVELSGRVVPLTPAQQERCEELQELSSSTAEGGCLYEKGAQHQEQLTRDMRQQLELFFLERKQLREAIHLSRSDSCAVGRPGASARPTVLGTEEASSEGAPGYKHDKLREALSRNVTDTGVAVGVTMRSPRGENEVGGKLAPEALANGSEGAGAGGAAASKGGGGVGTGGEHSPVCL